MRKATRNYSSTKLSYKSDSKPTEASLKEEKLINAIKLLHQNDTEYKENCALTNTNKRKQSSSYFRKTLASNQTDEFSKAEKSGNTVAFDNDYNKLDESIFCDCHKKLFDVEIKRGKYDDHTMGLLSRLFCCKKTDNEKDDDAIKGERGTRQNFGNRRNTDRRTPRVTSISSSSDISKIEYRYRDTAAPILSSSSRQSTYSTIPGQTKSVYDNVPSRELGNSLTFTESEISTIQKPIQAHIGQSSSRNTRNSKGYRHRDDVESSVASYSTGVQSTSNYKASDQSNLQENPYSVKTSPNLAKIPDARKMPVLEISQNITSNTQRRQTRSEARKNLQPANYSVQAVSPPITNRATLKSVELNPTEICHNLDPSNRYQAHSDNLGPKSYNYKTAKSQYRLSNASEIVQTTATYLEANSTTVSASSPVKNKFPTIISEQFPKPILVTENTRKNRSSRKTNTNLLKPYSVYDNLPLSTNSGAVEKFHSSSMLYDTKFKHNSKTNLYNSNTVDSEANSCLPILKFENFEKQILPKVESYHEYEPTSAITIEDKNVVQHSSPDGGYNRYFKNLEPDIISQPGKSTNLLNQLETSNLYYKNNRVDIPEERVYDKDVIDQTLSEHIFTSSKNEETVKTIQNDGHFERYRNTSTMGSVNFPEAQFADDTNFANNKDDNVTGAEQPWSSCNESSKNIGQNLSIFSQEDMQPRIQETSGKNHGDICDIKVPDTLTDKVLEADSKAIVIKDEIKEQNESEQENKRRRVKTKLDEVHNTAKQFVEEIDNFKETQASSKYYYIDESLRRLVDTLDDMYEDIGEDEYLRVERKKVYNCIFPLFDKLDEKVGGTN